MIVFRCMGCGEIQPDPAGDSYRHPCTNCGGTRFIKRNETETAQKVVDRIFGGVAVAFCLLALAVVLLGPDKVIGWWRWLTSVS